MNSFAATNPTEFNSIQSVWDRLFEIRSLTFTANSLNGNTGWCGKGEGNVRVEPINTHTMLFHEQGIWESETDKKFVFNNRYRWTQKESTNVIRLEHLRFGIDRPVLLFELQLKSETTLESASSHVCGDDSYSATIRLESKSLELLWTVKGPKKDEKIRYSYR